MCILYCTAGSLTFLPIYSDIEDGIESLKQFSTELVVEAASRCVEAIQPGSGIPTSLPPSMSMRFKIGAAIAQACMVGLKNNEA